MGGKGGLEGILTKRGEKGTVKGWNKKKVPRSQNHSEKLVEFTKHPLGCSGNVNWLTDTKEFQGEIKGLGRNKKEPLKLFHN